MRVARNRLIKRLKPMGWIWVSRVRVGTKVFEGGVVLDPAAYTEGPNFTNWLPNVDSNHEPSD